MKQPDTNLQNYPCRKLIHWLLLEHHKKQWKAHTKIKYPKLVPYSKKFMSSWIFDNLHGPTQVVAINAIDNLKCPLILESRYKKLNKDIWKILDDHSIRELIELEILYGKKIKEIHKKLIDRINPRNISLDAIEQFQYFFWNIEDDNGIQRPGKLVELIKSQRDLSKVYNHILKFYNDRYGYEKFEYYYNLKKSENPNIKNISKVLDLSVFEQIQALSDKNIDRLSALSSISLKSAKSYSLIRQHSADTDSPFLDDLFATNDAKIKNEEEA